MNNPFTSAKAPLVISPVDLKHLLFVILSYLCAGTFLSFGLVKPSEVGQRYFLYHGLGISALCLFAWFLLGPAPQPWFGFFILLSTIFAVTPARFRWVSYLAYTLALMCIVIFLTKDAAPSVIAEPRPFNESGYFVANAVLSSLLMGFCMAAMLLGHWYLVQPKLAIGELKRISLVLIVLIVVRLVYGAFLTWQLLQNRPENEIYRYLFSSSPGLFVTMRWSWGLVGPLVLSYFIWNTVKIRSTQSATGILYIAVLWVLTGETLSQYLAIFHGIPL